MTLHEHSLDGSSVTASAQLPIPNAPGNIHRRILVSMGLKPAHLTSERPLMRSVFPARAMTHTPPLGLRPTDSRRCMDPPFLPFPHTPSPQISQTARPSIPLLS